MDYVEGGIRYQRVDNVSLDEFDGYVDASLSPKIFLVDVRPAFNYYKSVFIKRDDLWYISLPKIKSLV